MSVQAPLVLATTENGLGRDGVFVRALAGNVVNVRVTPRFGSVLDGGTARLLKKQRDAASAAGFEVVAFLVQVDADTTSLDGRVAQVKSWARQYGLLSRPVRLIPCVPVPCLERWLCAAEARRPRAASPSRGCAPWKAEWERGRGNDLDRVRSAAATAPTTLAALPDFDAFLRAWRRAGLP